MKTPRSLSVIVLLLGSCVTPTTLRPELQGLATVAVVSIHGSHDVGIVNTTPGGFAVGDGVGEQAIELLQGDTATFVEGLFGQGNELLPATAMTSKKYDQVPEALPPEDWSQVDRILAVDVANERTPAALAALARDLDVDASVVIRHEWWMTQERYELVRMVYLYDRCTILVVDRDGTVLWRQVAMPRLPARALWGVQLQFGLNGADSVSEARALARETARLAYAELTQAFKALPPSPPSAAVRTRTPPPLLDSDALPSP